ncbi:MAG: tRNA epoxyqueuosine(34) reductase QueG [Bacteroidetes bacterium]|nr:MAG: tRNA epoxyqueuosine(34) reductase QueG [Bacteroidota bacterium]
MDAKASHTAIIKRLATELGFEAVGIAKARFLEEEAPRLEEWLNNNYHGQMAYMANHFDKRLDPQKLVPGAKSVVSLLYNYYPGKDLAPQHGYKLAKYAYGKDYHEIIKAKLWNFLDQARAEIGEINGRVFVDSAPVMERQWAQLAGIGWLGKNGLLLNKNKGSFHFIAELIIDIDLDYDSPIPDYCGRCTKCIDACPTKAIVEPGVVNGSKCISHYTIELKSEMPITEEKSFENWVFGCDICQDVCPWNRFSQPHNEPAFLPTNELQSMKVSDWEELTQETFNSVFNSSAVKRTKFSGLMRNLDFIIKQDH